MPDVDDIPLYSRTELLGVTIGVHQVRDGEYVSDPDEIRRVCVDAVYGDRGNLSAWARRNLFTGQP